MPKKPPTAAAHAALIETLHERFERHPARHAGIGWPDVLARLQAHPAALAVLQRMEDTGGEPDVTGRDDAGAIVYTDCAVESPTGRRSLCFDRAAYDARKENRPADNAADLAAEIGIALLTEAQYRALQTLGEFDLKTSSWIATPPEIRALGGALFCDRRYGAVFTYHNGAQSYYAARGFRGRLAV